MRIAILGLMVLLVVGGTLVMTFAGNRPRPDRFLRINDLASRPEDLSQVAIVLRRTRIGRLTGGVVGLVVGAFGCVQLGAAGAIAGAEIGLLAGTMFGITAAQPPARRPSSTPRTASLTVRDAREYLPRRARATTLGLAAVVVGYAVFAAATAFGPLGTMSQIFLIGLATVGAVPAGRTFERRTVELRRPEADAESIRVDDALRACALRGIHHATIGILMCGLFLVGYGAVATQNVTTVEISGRPALRVRSISTIAVPEPFLPLTPDGRDIAPPTRYRVSWTELGGTSHSKVIHTGGRTLTMKSLDVGPLLGIGYWAVVIGFVGALIQWGRAAKAWRRPQRAPSLVAPVAALGMA